MLRSLASIGLRRWMSVVLAGSSWCFFFQAEDGIRDIGVTGVQTCALPIYMKFSAQLDVTMVAHETDDEVALLLELVAPPAPSTGEPRPASSLQVVLDRSGSIDRKSVV